MKKLALLLSACLSLVLYAQKEMPSSNSNEVLIVDTYRFNDSIYPSEFDLPLRIPPLLSANFGELRSDHFHSGLDFKTQGLTGKPVYAVALGRVSRISVRVQGYGKALYLDHPNGYTSVYAHLESLSPRLDSVLKAAQYTAESYEQNLVFSSGQLPVSRGELLGYSGNTGSSGGPHLHFELRQTESEDPVDPLFWYKDRIKDTRPPLVNALAVYAIEGQGLLLNRNGNFEQKEIIPYAQEGEASLNAKLPSVWGRIALGIKAYSYMNGTNNIYGLSLIRLYLNGEEIFCQDMSRFSFDESRYLNAMVDYEEWTARRSWIMKSYLEPLNLLDIYPVKRNNGFVNINQEQVYRFCYELYDRAGNMTQFCFKLQGREMNISKEDSSLLYFYPAYNNTYTCKDLKLSFPAGSFYNKVPFEYELLPPLNPARPGINNPTSYTGLHKIHNANTALHKAAGLSIKISDDRLREKNWYYLARVLPDGKIEYVPAKYSEGIMEAKIWNLGTYTVLSDSIAPKIFLPQLDKNQKKSLIRIVVLDDESGLDSYRCIIDGRWALFEYDYKTHTLTADLRDGYLNLDAGDHFLQLYVSDKCGNEQYKEWKFTIDK